MTHEFWQSIERGAKRAGEDLGKQGISVEVRFDGPSREDDAKPQIDIINHHISRQVSGIVLAPQHKTNMVDSVESAVNQKIPVVIIDSDLDRPELYVKYVATNNYNGGKLAAMRLLDVLAADGKKAPRIVLFRYQVGSESTEERERGFLDHVNGVIEKQKAAGEDAVPIVSQDIYLGATRDTASANAKPYLDKKGTSIDGIFAPNESSAGGVIEAMRGLGLLHKIRLVGFDSSAPLLQSLRKDEIHGLIVQDPYRMGYLGVWTLVHHLEGYNVTPGNEKYLGTGEYLVTRENMDEPRIRELFDAELQAQRDVARPEFSK
jgi:ribose transport system substrate-binding protein